MTVLVTGAGGFIGSHLVEALLAEAADVRALLHYNGRNDWGHLEHLKGAHTRLEVRLGDVTDGRLVAEAVDGCELVYHLAALIGIPYSYVAPSSYVATNIGGALNVLEACRQHSVRRLVLTSTSEVYGTARYTPIDEAHPLQAQSPYAASKIGADKLSEAYHLSFGVPVTIIRPFNTYGPRQSQRAIVATILTQCLAGSSPLRLGNLDPRRDLTYVADTVRAFLLAGHAADIEGETIHFGQGSAVSIRELVELCMTLTGHRTQIDVAPDRVRPSTSEVELLLCGASKAEQKLGWAPEVALDEGLRLTWQSIERDHKDPTEAGYVV